MKAQRGNKCIALLFLQTSALDGAGGQRHASVALLPGKTRYPLYGRLDGPQRRSVQVRIISDLPRFDLRTFQPLASRYTDCDISAHCFLWRTLKVVCEQTVFYGEFMLYHEIMCI